MDGWDGDASKMPGPRGAISSISQSVSHVSQSVANNQSVISMIALIVVYSGHKGRQDAARAHDLSS